MKKIEQQLQEAKQLLQPIKQRPELEPNSAFVQELHQRIQREKTKKKFNLNFYPFFATASVLLIFTIFILSTNFSNEEAEEIGKAFPILETSKLTLVDTFAYGNEEGQVGLYFEGMKDTLPVSVAGFDVKDGIVYLLDEARSQVVIKSAEGETTSFSIQQSGLKPVGLDDILVSENGDIYILYTERNLVYQYSENGDLIETHLLSGVYSFFPDSLLELENNQIIVSQRQERFFSLETNEFMNREELPFQLEQVNRKESTLQILKGGKMEEITLFSELGLAERAVLDLREEHVLYTQTVKPPVMESISETHVYALDREGSIVGGIRIPEEKFMETPQLPQKFLKTDGDSIYLLIPEKEHVALYEITLGEKYESFAKEQLAEVDNGFDYETFGSPFPQLEAEINKIFIDGLLEYGNEQSLNGVAIDENGTVVIDFKDFLAPSPANAQAQQLFEVLKAATFEKFPQIEQIYFQFDGSFSAWCYWLESTEEPWKRKDAIGASLQDELTLTEKTAALFKDLEDLNWEGIATHVHEEKGLTFSFYASLGSFDSGELTFTKSEVANLGNDNTSYVWGYDNADRGHEYSPNNYVKEILLKHQYSKEVLDYAVVTFNKQAYVSGGVRNTIHENYPDAVYVDYFSPPPEGEYGEYYWQALRFVYEQTDNQWLLIAIVRDVHNP
ncbi:GerMN domain-containing protein [Bacillus alkalisoli]|uniref:GerMN domain-containing protein n=1 Tax=Bacillus alkalisoli TaxID=2011008 RepID=UPI000C23C5B4|nr:GerMN domain-containing protein [Bacillus alkalisoli]